MSDQRNRDKALRIIEVFFKILLFAYTACGTCNLIYGKPVISYIMYAAFLTGVFVLLSRVIFMRSYYRMPLLIFAIVMWISYAVSVAANFRYFSKNALVFLILWSFYFFIFYTQRNDRSAENIAVELRGVSVIYMIWTNVLMFISFWMLCTGYAHAYRDPHNADYEVAAGFFSGRLWGAFQDPNLGALMCCMLIVFCIYWIMRHKNILLRMVLVVDIILAVFYITMSDSRNGMVSLGVLAAVLFGIIWHKHSDNKLSHAVLGLVIMMLIFGAGFEIPKLMQKVYNECAVEINEYVDEKNNSANISEDDKSKVHLGMVDRGYDITGENLGNRRFDIWKSGIEIGMQKPVTGVSFVGAVPYAKDHLPNTYIISNDLWNFNTFDNELVNIFAGQGFLGFLTVMAWLLAAVILYFKKARSISDRYFAEFTVMTTIVCTLIISALFQGTMFYQTTPNTLLFWMCFGGCMYMLKSAGKEADES